MIQVEGTSSSSSIIFSLPLQELAFYEKQAYLLPGKS